MSAFSNHSICEACWVKRNPGRTPVTVTDDFHAAETCCFCRYDTKDGIYVREKNDAVACKTDHSRPVIAEKKGTVS